MVTAALLDIRTIIALAGDGADAVGPRRARVLASDAVPAASNRTFRSDARACEAEEVAETPEATAERILLDAAREGDDDAFARLCEEGRPRLIRHLLSRGEMMDDAEEIAQEALARAWRSLSGFDGRSRFYTWLYGIARHVRLDMRRSRRRRPDSAPGAPRVDEETAIPAREEAPISGLIAEERRTRLAQALEGLPERQRKALLLRFVDERGCDEIGDLLGTTANGASMLIFRAKSELSLALPAEWFGRRVA